MKLSIPPGTPRFLLLSALACAALSFIVLLDFALPSQSTQDVVVSQVVHYNRGTRGGAGYYAYTTQCRHYAFASDEVFSGAVPEGDTLILGLTPLLREVSWYTSQQFVQGKKRTSTSRYGSGLLLPLAMIGLCLGAFRFNNLHFLGMLFAVQVLTVINFIVLLS
jgi:hypothetical protein